VNYATGGTEFKPGVASPTPDQIDYLIGQATGGVGREASKLVQSIGGATTGEDVPMHKIPLFGRFIGTTEGQAAESGRFYGNLKSIGEHKAEMDGLRKSGRGADFQKYMRENPDAAMVQMADKMQRNVSELVKQKRELIKMDAEPARVKLIEAQITARMKQFNDMVRARKERQAA
jgi:hypothetical protein